MPSKTTKVYKCSVCGKPVDIQPIDLLAAGGEFKEVWHRDCYQNR